MSDAILADSKSGEVIEVLTEDEAAEYAKIDRVIKKFTPRFKELNAKIKRIYTTKGTRIIGDVVIKMAQRVSKDAKSAEKKYPAKKYPQFYETVEVFQFDKLSAAQQKPFLGTTLALSVEVVAKDSPESE